MILESELYGMIRVHTPRNSTLGDPTPTVHTHIRSVPSSLHQFSDCCELDHETKQCPLNISPDALICFTNVLKFVSCNASIRERTQVHEQSTHKPSSHATPCTSQCSSARSYNTMLIKPSLLAPPGTTFVAKSAGFRCVDTQAVLHSPIATDSLIAW